VCLASDKLKHKSDTCVFVFVCGAQPMFSTIEDIYVALVDTDRGQKEKVHFYDTAGLVSFFQFLHLNFVNKMTVYFILLEYAYMQLIKPYIFCAL